MPPRANFGGDVPPQITPPAAPQCGMSVNVIKPVLGRVLAVAGAQAGSGSLASIHAGGTPIVPGRLPVPVLGGHDAAHEGWGTVPSMAERVVPVGGHLTWEPNAPEAVLLSDDHRRSILGLRAHPDDPDRRCVLFVWHDVRYVLMSDPNDEALSGHRLYSRGLRDLRWLGVVEQSELVNTLEKQNSVHALHGPARFGPLVHHVLMLKECAIEVVARELSVNRLEAPSTRAAVVAALVA